MDLLTPIKFAVLGYGNQGRRHAECIERNPQASLCAIIDTDSDKLAGLNGLAYHSLAAMYEAGIRPDVICIATPNGMHQRHALLALTTTEYVIIEKPISLSNPEAFLPCKERIFCVMQNRFTPAAQWLKSLDFGEIFSVHVNCFWNRGEGYYHENNWRGTKQMDGGTLFTQFSHFIDILLWICGDIHTIGGVSKNVNHPYTGIDDCGSFVFTLPGKGIGSFNYSVNATGRNMESSITIIGEKGTVKVGGQYMSHVEYCDGFELPKLPEPNAPNQYGGKYEGSAGNLQAVIDNAVDTIMGRAEIAVPVTEGIKVVNTINNFYHVQRMRTKTEATA